MRHLIYFVCVLTLALGLGVACEDKKEGGDDKEKTEGGKEKLDAEAECGTFYDDNSTGNGDKDAFVEACKQDMANMACAGPASGSGFCQDKMNDEAAKAQIEAMKAAL